MTGSGRPPTDRALVERLRAIVEADERPGDDRVLALIAGRTADRVASAVDALTPIARERHRRLGLTHQVSAATLADIPRKHALYGADTVAAWLVGLLRADVVAAGRLQVERRAGEHGHALHVPETGPLTPAAVDDAIARARELTGSDRFSCESWLLDRGLTAALPASNIAAFARRFEIVADGAADGSGDEAVAKFVFRRNAEAVRASVIEPRTALERLVVRRLRSGAHWTQPLGRLRSP